MTRLFVPGSPPRSEHIRPVMAGVRFIGEATALGFALFDLGQSTAMVASGSGTVIGEVYEVGARHLLRLDRLEGHPRRCQRTTIALEDGSEAAAYLMQSEQVTGRTRVESNGWTRQKEQPT